MTDHIFLPGPTPTTVRAADGKVQMPPAGWVLLPPGDAALTRRVKAAGDHWIMQEKKERKVFSRGVWAPATTIDRIRVELEAERSTEGFAKRKEADAQAPWYTVEADDKRRARLNCIAHMLSMVPYEDAMPPPLKLPPRRPADETYVRPPKLDQNIVPDVEL